MKDRFKNWFWAEGCYFILAMFCFGVGIAMGWSLWGYAPSDDTAQTTVMVEVDTKTLEDYGTRVQYSVFEVNLEARHVKKMRSRLERVIDKKEDSIRFYTLCGACYQSIEVLGVGRAGEKPAEVLII